MTYSVFYVVNIIYRELFSNISLIYALRLKVFKFANYFAAEFVEVAFGNYSLTTEGLPAITAVISMCFFRRLSAVSAPSLAT